MFRWKGIIAIIIIVVVAFILTWLLTDRWLEGQLEDFGSSLVGAKVEIDNLDFSLWGPKIRWDRLQVTHPRHTMKNMIETDVCQFGLEFWPLLSKKVIVENFQIEGIRTFTNRETDGALPKAEREEKSGFVSQTIRQLSQQAETATAATISDFSQKVNVDSILKILNIQSVQRMDSLQKELLSKYNQWDKTLAEWDLKNDISKMEQDLKSLDIRKIENVQDLQKALTTADNLKKNVDALNNEFKSTRKNFAQDLDQARAGLGQVDDWVKADYVRARSLAKIPDISVENIGMMIFGQQVVDRFNTYLGYVETTRMYADKFKSDKPPKEKPPRLKGQNIHFVSSHARPNWWIQRISLSGETSDALQLQGALLNLVSDQQAIQKPTSINISGSKEDGASLSFSGLLNYLGEQPEENFELEYNGFSMANTKLSDHALLPNTLKKGIGRVRTNLQLRGERIDGKIEFTGTALQFDFTEQKRSMNAMERIIRDIIQNINQVNFSAQIKSVGGDLIFRVSSNLDELLARNLKAAVSKEIEAAERQIRDYVDKEVSKQRRQLEQMIKERETQLRAELEKYEQLVNETIARAEAKKKEIEDKIEAEKKKLENDAKDRLKKLIR